MKGNIKRERCLLILFPILSMLIVGALLLVYNHENNKVHHYYRSEFEEKSIAEARCDIEAISEDEEGDCYIKGWFVLPGITYDFYNYGNDNHSSSAYNYVNVCVVDKNDIYVLPTKLEERQDVNELIGDGVDYKYSGFQAKVSSELSNLVENKSIAFLVKDPDDKKTLYVQESK